MPTAILRVLHAIFVAIEYNRDDEFMRDLLVELLHRFKRENCNWSDEGNIIYSTLVIMFGEYGTSPRSGWFEEGYRLDAIRYLEGRLTNYDNQ